MKTKITFAPVGQTLVQIVANPLLGSPTPTPTPAPAFTAQPSIAAADGTPQVGELLTGSDGTITNGTVSARQWLIGSTAISGATGATYTPTQTGSYTYRVAATGPGGTINATSTAVTVAAATVTPTPTPTPTPSPSISFANPAVTVTEGNTGSQTVTNTINVVRDGLTGAVTINLTYGGTAVSGADYVAGPTSLTIGAGQSSGSFDLTVNGDAAIESDETIVITAALAGYSATASKTITVTNDDVAPTPTIAISAAQSKNEGNSGSTAYTYTVTRSASSGAVNVAWAFAAGTASADDFAGGAYPAGGTVALADGAASGTFTINVGGDTTVEPDEQFTVSITAPSGYALGSPSSATGTILNDDTAATPFFGSSTQTWGASDPVFGAA